MRTWCLWLLMVLLPWRLWAADAMAFQTAAPAPCHMAMDVAMDVTVDSQHHTADFSADGQPTHHALCDICHGTVAAPTPLTAWTRTEVPSIPPPVRLASPDSVLWAPDLRPPIA